MKNKSSAFKQLGIDLSDKMVSIKSLRDLRKHLFTSLLIAAIATALGCSKNREFRTIMSGHMTPTLITGDKILFDSSAPTKRGDIVVFNSPYSFDPVLNIGLTSKSLQCQLAKIPIVSSIPGLSHPACEQYVSRVIALEGDSVRVNPQGEVRVNGVDLDEPYVTNYCGIDKGGMSLCRTLNATVPEGRVLVLGDNRSNSWDGRYWPGGAFVPVNELGGSARNIVLPSERQKSFE